jgi:hypothetical protein
MALALVSRQESQEPKPERTRGRRLRTRRKACTWEAVPCVLRGLLYALST